MRISDVSSDVCSSDLDVALLLVDLAAALADRSALDAVDALFDSRAVLLLNKVDRCEPAAVDRLCQELQDRRPLPLSVKTGQGLEALLARLVERAGQAFGRSEEHTSELQSLMRISYAVFCLKKKKTKNRETDR